MIIYLTVIILSVLLWRRVEHLCPLPEQPQRYALKRKFYFLLLLLLLGGVAGWRKYVGTDYGNYIDVYLVTKDKPLSTLLSRDEALFSILVKFCGKAFGDYIPIFVICAMATMALILRGIYRSSTNYPLSAFLFIAGMYYFDLFNGMRQMIATAILFAAYPLFRKRRWWPLIFLTLIAYGFHASAPMILIVFLFAAYNRPNSQWTGLVILFFVAITVFYNGFIENLVNLLNKTDSAYLYYEDMLYRDDLGANVLRFGLAAVPAAFGLYGWKEMSRNREDAAILVNISLVNALFMLLATRNWIFARYSLFFGIYNILLWPEIIRCFKGRNKAIMTFGVVLVYSVYFWLIVHTDSNLLPYQSWIFGGVYH